MFIARLLFKEKSLRFYNWEYPNRGRSSSSWGPVATLIYTLSKGFEGRKPARKNSSRKGGKIKISKAMVLTEEKSVVMRLPWIFSFLLPRIQELSPPQ